VENKILVLIKKLLSLATSDNEHEAKLASSKATELLTKHNLNMQQLNYATAEYTEEDLFEGLRVTNEFKYVSGILVKHFNVRIIKDLRGASTTIRILGDKTNVQVATYTYEYLTIAFKRLFKQWNEDNNGSARDRSSYYFGLVKGFNEQMEQAKKKVESEHGLVLVPDAGLVKFMKAQHPKLRTSTSRLNAHNADATAAGQEAGQNLKVNRGINDGSFNSNKMLKA
jgi:hypothetical protein